jgi:hypothetical protein
MPDSDLSDKDSEIKSQSFFNDSQVVTESEKDTNEKKKK